MKRLLPLFVLLAGCSTTLPQKYTVADLPAEPVAQLHVSAISVRMAKDLRAYDTPLYFKADGTVTPLRDLTYYAPLEVAIERALTDATMIFGTGAAPLKVTVEDFCLDARGETLQAKVTLASGPHSASAIENLDTLPSTPQLRNIFGDLLLEAYQNLAKLLN